MKNLLVLLLLVGMVGLNSGCAHTINAIEHAQMQVNVKMKDSIFLTPEKNRTVYVRVTNTSEMQEIALDNLLADKLAAKGYERVSDPEQAAYRLQVNVLYFDLLKKGMTPDGMLVGSAGGALVGAVLGGRGWKGPVAGALIGSVVGGLAGAAVGAAFHVDTYAGAIDMQIAEGGKAVGTATTVATAKQGASGSTTTETKTQTNISTYQTRLVAWATQTRIDKTEAAQVVAQKLADQISRIF